MEPTMLLKTQVAKKILVVDDEEAIREVVTLSLEAGTAWSVLTASSGADALDLVRRERPDAILMDVMMPDMGGPEVLRQLQAARDTSQIPVILLTGKAPSPDSRSPDQGPFAGCEVAGVIAKPFDPLRLAGQVAACLGWEAPNP